MHNSRTNRILLIILIILAILIIGLLLYPKIEEKNYFRNEFNKETVPSGGEVNSKTNLDTSTWKTETWNGVSFKYPPDWVIGKSYYEKGGVPREQQQVIGWLLGPKGDKAPSQIFIGTIYTGSTEPPSDFFDIQTIEGVDFGIKKQKSPAEEDVFNKIIASVKKV